MKKLLPVVVLIIIALIVFLAWPSKPASAPESKTIALAAKTNSEAKPESNNKIGQSFNRQEFSLTNPASIWVIVNKQHPLQPKSYTPTDLVVPSVPLRVPGNNTMQLRAPAASALETMFAAARQDDVELMLASGYRSYSYQVTLYNSYVKAQGQAAADTYSARPGYSEHQTGLAADIEATNRQCELEQCFAETPAGKWIAANAYKYGFIVRYPPDKVSITGYIAEPWHVRYIGQSLANEMHRTNVETLEEFFGISGGTSYN